MTDPRAIPLDAGDWEEEAPGIRSRAADVDGARWAEVAYAAGARRAEWCTEGHKGFVLAGAIRYEFDDGTAPIEAAAGQAFLLPDGQGHRGTNLADGETRLFLIDGPV
jgi:quercetin dioxygenase-like cupin family protein